MQELTPPRTRLQRNLIKYSMEVLVSATKRRFWSIGFSGGKDSSVLLDLVIRFLQDGCPSAPRCPEKIIVVYSDTLLEPPPVRHYALGVVEAVNRIARRSGLPLVATEASPIETQEDLVEMVIGRGYPAPSPRFRWCTDRWKIRPTRKVLQKLLGGWRREELAVISGIRAEEAIHRSRKSVGSCICPLAMSDYVGGVAYAPLLPWSSSDIWAYIESYKPIWGQPDWSNLRGIYGSSRDELRMGCWACTLISRDRGWEDLAKRDYVEPSAYALLDTWRKIWLHMSRTRPDLWRTTKKILVTRSGRQWRYHYSKLRPEARLLLGYLLKIIAQKNEEAREILKPLLSRLEDYLLSLRGYIPRAKVLLKADKELQKHLATRALLEQLLSEFQD